LYRSRKLFTSDFYLRRLMSFASQNPSPLASLSTRPAGEIRLPFASNLSGAQRLHQPQVYA
jgi:hypothetical protein